MFLPFSLASAHGGTVALGFVGLSTLLDFSSRGLIGFNRLGVMEITKKIQTETKLNVWCFIFAYG